MNALSERERPQALAEHVELGSLVGRHPVELDAQGGDQLLGIGGGPAPVDEEGEPARQVRVLGRHRGDVAVGGVLEGVGGPGVDPAAPGGSGHGDGSALESAQPSKLRDRDRPARPGCRRSRGPRRPGPAPPCPGHRRRARSSRRPPARTKARPSRPMLSQLTLEVGPPDRVANSGRPPRACRRRCFRRRRCRRPRSRSRRAGPRRPPRSAGRRRRSRSARPRASAAPARAGRNRARPRAFTARARPEEQGGDDQAEQRPGSQSPGTEVSMPSSSRCSAWHLRPNHPVTDEADDDDERRAPSRPSAGPARTGPAARGPGRPTREGAEAVTGGHAEPAEQGLEVPAARHERRGTAHRSEHNPQHGPGDAEPSRPMAAGGRRRGCRPGIRARSRRRCAPPVLRSCGVLRGGHRCSSRRGCLGTVKQHGGSVVGNAHLRDSPLGRPLPTLPSGSRARAARTAPGRVGWPATAPSGRIGTS